MRYLNFNVDQMFLEKTGDFENLIAKSKGYLFAKFNFSRDWKSLTKVAVFTNKYNDVIRFEPIIDNMCKIPDIITEYNHINVYIVGRNNENNVDINTNEVTFSQKGGI